MATLNNKASELIQEVKVHACTDISGFGFLGHTIQLARNSKIGISIDTTAIPVFSEAIEFAKQGMIPAGLHRNRDFYSPDVQIVSDIPLYIQDILYDPQTSGGLLICVATGKADRLLNKLKQAGIKEAAIIGEVVREPEGKLVVK